MSITPSTLNIASASNSMSLISSLASPLPLPTANDATQFRQLAGIEGGISTELSLPIKNGSNALSNASTSSGDGGSILQITNSLQSISSGIKEKTIAIGTLVSGIQRAPNISEMLKVQMEIAQLSLQTQWIGDIVSKAGKNVEQLTHLQ